jgi:hypothetical protein
VRTVRHSPQKTKPKQAMKTQAFEGAGNGQVTEAFARWLMKQPVKVQENHMECLNTNQLVELSRLICKLCPW